MSSLPPTRFLEPLSKEQQAAVLASHKVANWLERIAAEFVVQEVVFERVYFFGSKVGYVLAQAAATTKEGRPVPGIAFIRGDAIAVLLVLRSPDGAEHTVLVRQPRLPAGVAAYEEIPAGMIDEGTFQSKALEELKEEVGADIDVSESDLHLLETINTSPGGSDESLQIYYAAKSVSAELIQSLEGRENSQAGEHEYITVSVVPLHDLAHRASADMKARLAYLSYCAHMRLLPSVGREEAHPF